MDVNVSEEQWRQLVAMGFLRLPGAAKASVAGLMEAVDTVLRKYPYGFADPKYYTGTRPQSLTKDTARPDGRILVPYIGFMDPRILAPLANPILHELLERVVGKEFYLSNTWYQEVPPGTPRLAYHKDARGSITFNILLDEILTGMGSTCVVPGSHVNTPPAAYCFHNLHARHPAEIDLTGHPGDIVLFSPENWHARSRNDGPYTTRRLFYNFYSRSSRTTTTWDGIVDFAQVEAARATFPREFQHMFEIDHDRTRQIAEMDGSRFKAWAFAKSSSDEVLRDAVYAAFAYGCSAENSLFPGFLLPNTTRLVEGSKYRAVEYFSHFKILPSLRNFYVQIRQYLKAIFLRPQGYE